MKRKKRFHALFYFGKHTKPTDDNIMRLLAPSLIGIVACMLCLVGTTWAWFFDVNTTPPSRLTAADFQMASEVKNIQGESAEAVAKNVWLLDKGRYTVKLTASGTARTGGYCEVLLGDDAYHTVQMYSVEERGKLSSVSFTVDVASSEPVILSIEPHWGRLEDAEQALAASGDGISYDGKSSDEAGDPETSKPAAPEQSNTSGGSNHSSDSNHSANPGGNPPDSPDHSTTSRPAGDPESPASSGGSDMTPSSSAPAAPSSETSSEISPETPPETSENPGESSAVPPGDSPEEFSENASPFE